MFKKIVLLMAISLLLGLSFGQSSPVFDYLGVLSEQEEANLRERIERIRSAHDFDVVIVMTDVVNGKSSRDYADDFYDENGFGLDARNSGILMLVNMYDREVWLSTTGRGIEVFTDQRIDGMTDAIASRLSDGDFYKAALVFLEDLSTYLERGVPQGQVTVDSEAVKTHLTYFQRVGRLLKNPIVYLVALVISVVATGALSLESKGKKTTHYQTYESEGSFDLKRTEDT